MMSPKIEKLIWKGILASTPNDKSCRYRAGQQKIVSAGLVELKVEKHSSKPVNAQKGVTEDGHKVRLQENADRYRAATVKKVPMQNNRAFENDAKVTLFNKKNYKICLFPSTSQKMKSTL